MKTILAVIAVFLVLAAGCAQQGPIVGNDSDIHGCKASAGYTWCDSMKKCIRPFEENCTVACTQEAKICPDGSAVGRTGPDCAFAPCPQLVGNDSDAHGCKASAGYSWCEAKQQCIRPFETACEGSLKESDVRAIAEQACGNLTGNVSYNSNSKTYWIDLDMKKSGCSPACVVWEENKSAEVNWRCTGLIQYTVKKTDAAGLGEILTDGNGMTLYVFTADAINKSNCAGTCEANWPPLIVSENIITQSGIPGDLGAIARPDKSIQVTYNGMPLYRYAADKNPGDTNGQGIGGKWFVAQTNMTAFPG